MRQCAPGGAQGGRSQRPAAAAPPGVPVPADSPLIAAFQHLEAAKAYRVRMEMSTTDPRAKQAMQQMGGMDRYDKTVVKPDTQSVALHMSLPAVDQPGKSDDWEVRSVVKGNRAARKFDTPAKARILALQEAQVAKQMAQADLSATMSIAQAAAVVPSAWVAGGGSDGVPWPIATPRRRRLSRRSGILRVDLPGRARRERRRAIRPTA